jgi:ubiquinone/menaquinone biosynthesis C-methylase UbiE
MVQTKKERIMDTIKKIFSADHARQYDQKVIASKWLDPAIVFGLAFKFVSPGDRLLDVGIGTGVSSELFHKAGLKIHGIDFSPEMLSRCRAKQISVDLIEHDLSKTPYPLSADSMDHAVCTGVTHLFEDMRPIFRELSRILKVDGIFAFVVADCDDGESRVKKVDPKRHSHAKKVSIYCYSPTHIEKILDSCGFKKLVDLKFWASAIGNRPGRYKAYVVQKR